MCISMPKAPRPPPPPAERQAMTNPKDIFSSQGLSAKRRRGLYASVFTSPQGVSGPPAVTGSMGGTTGG